MSRLRTDGAAAGGGHEGGSERWLLTYADMITLLLALFIVLWSISTVNISKFAALKQSLAQAFSGKVLQGSSGVLDGGPSPLNPQGTQVDNVDAQSASSSSSSLPTPNSIAQSIQLQIAQSASQAERGQPAAHPGGDRRGREEARALEGHPHVDRRAGARVRLLTDKVLFGSGQAVAAAAGVPLLDDIARSSPATRDQPRSRRGQHRQRADLDVAVPVQLGALDGPGHGRARGADPPRHRRRSASRSPATATENPIASNGTVSGRSLNRRVDIVVLRNSTTRQETLK